MKVLPVSFSQPITNQRQVSTNMSSRKTALKSQHDNVTFTCYQNSLALGVHTILNHENQAEKFFDMIFTDLLKASYLKSSDKLDEIAKLHKSKGMFGVLTEFWRPVSNNSVIKELVKKAEEKNVILARTKENKPLLEVHNWGRNGFWNALTDNADATRDVRLVFNYPNTVSSVEFGLDKKGRLNVLQYKNGSAVFTKFHRSTGHRMQQTFHSDTGNPEVYYYNKDGSKNWFKNWIQGGTIIPSMW